MYVCMVNAPKSKTDTCRDVPLRSCPPCKTYFELGGIRAGARARAAARANAAAGAGARERATAPAGAGARAKA